MIFLPTMFTFFVLINQEHYVTRMSGFVPASLCLFREKEKTFYLDEGEIGFAKLFTFPPRSPTDVHFYFLSLR